MARADTCHGVEHKCNVASSVLHLAVVAFEFCQIIFDMALPIVCQKGVFLENQRSAFKIITASTTAKGLILFLCIESATAITAGIATVTNFDIITLLSGVNSK